MVSARRRQQKAYAVVTKMNRITEMFLLSNHGICLETDEGYFGVKFPGVELTELYKWAQWLKCTYMYC